MLGFISRRDIDKAKHHGLSAPVKGYMSTDPITISSTMSIEEVQNLMIDKNVGRLPVIENSQLIGIISRTIMIEALHGEKIKAGQSHTSQNPIEVSLLKRMHLQLSEPILELLKRVGDEADKINYRAFLISRSVRDLDY
ncbi:CBS domain-containing protein [Anaerobacillus sp. HL2]|nr:CBS domain-containing protein [Anaerobacillus sp. HL2]